MAKNKNNKYSVRSAHCLVRDPKGRYLLQRRSPEVDKNRFSRWGLFGGKIDLNEDPYDAMVREFWEETRVILKSKKLREIIRFSPREGKLSLIFAYQSDTSFIPSLCDESLGYKWVKPKGFPQPLHFTAKRALKYLRK